MLCFARFFLNRGSMSSTSTFNGHSKIAPNNTDTPFSPPLRPSSRRTPSFSSSPSLSSNSSSSSTSSFFHHDSPLFSPSTPLRSFLGVPFSWEKLPGIPKKQLSKKIDPSLSLLPLPPAGTPTPSSFSSKKINSNFHQNSPLRKKNFTSESFRRERDPFFMALMECSKDDHDHDHDDQQNPIGSFNLWKSSKVTRTLSDRFGFINMYTSCKSTCPVSESVIYIPRSGRS
ncbi:unnamed protein product [Camellia sinensis]